MKIPTHFDPSIGLESISVKEPEQIRNLLSDRSPVGTKEALPLALAKSFHTYQLKHFLMHSLLPEYFAQEGLLKDRLKRLLKLLSEDEEIKGTEFLSLLREEYDRQETIAGERQKQIGP